MENDLIRRSDALRVLDNNACWWAHEAMEHIPAVDAVEVCRCGQCKFTEMDCEDAIYCQKMDRFEMPPDGYCAWGQRREDGLYESLKRGLEEAIAFENGEIECRKETVTHDKEDTKENPA